MSTTETITTPGTGSSLTTVLRPVNQKRAPDVVKSRQYHQYPLWTGPSRITTVRTGKPKPFKSLLNTNSEETAISKRHHDHPIFLSKNGFSTDEQHYPDHQIPSRAMLQYNDEHYSTWRKELPDLLSGDQRRREEALSPGGFGENICAVGPEGGVRMDERSICIGDIIGIRRPGASEAGMVQIQVTGPRQPCYKLNHRFGVADMALRAQKKCMTGWLHSVIEEGEVQVGDEMVLLKRPFPEWPVARVQWYLYTAMKDLEAIEEIVDKLGDLLVPDVKTPFVNRLNKISENMLPRLTGEFEPASATSFTEYRLLDKVRHTSSVSEFIFSRVQPVGETDVAKAVPGSHMQLRIPVTNGRKLMRPYSVLYPNSNNNIFHLGVASSSSSRGGSEFLHKTLKVGDVIEASTSFTNTFPLAPATQADKHIFLAGGIGITAFLAHISTCMENGVDFHLHYMIPSLEEAAFLDCINNFLKPDSRSTKSDSGLVTWASAIKPNARATLYTSTPANRCSISEVLGSVAAEERTHVYICGPTRLSSAVLTTAADLNISSTRLHFETFTPPTADEEAELFVAELALQGGREIEVPASQSLLEVLRDAGIEVGSSCEVGSCGTCRVRARGDIHCVGSALTKEERDGGEMLACIDRGVGRIVLEL